MGAIRANPANRCRAQAVLFVAFDTTNGRQGFLISSWKTACRISGLPACAVASSRPLHQCFARRAIVD